MVNAPHCQVCPVYQQEGTDNFDCPWLLEICDINPALIVVLITSNQCLVFSVVLSLYRVVVDEEQVMLGNDILMKCDIPSFEADFVFVDDWVDSEGMNIAKDKNYHGNGT